MEQSSTKDKNGSNLNILIFNRDVLKITIRLNKHLIVVKIDGKKRFHISDVAL